MKIAVLTSSRADYGIYKPLLNILQKDKSVNLRLIVFGTHTSKKFGMTINAIKKDGFKIDYALDTTPKKDSAYDIALAMVGVQKKFAKIWQEKCNVYDRVICLGDRYEMYAAVSAAVPFNMTFAHLYGGETTLGAIDDVYRHAITLFSKLHFTALGQNSKRVASITGSAKNIYTAGALSLDNLKEVKLLTKEEFKKTYSIDITKPTLLVTFHPQTVNPGENKKNLREVLLALKELSMQTIITMPNSDAMGLFFRAQFESYAKKSKEVFLIETFGTQGYFSAMKHCTAMLGNSSSGIIEAASLNCYALNIGDRQKGRAASKNVVNCRAVKEDITAAVKKISAAPKYKDGNIYWQGGAAKKIARILKQVEP